MRIRMGVKEVGIVSIENDKSMAGTEVQKNVELEEVEQGIVCVVAVQAELYHPKRHQPHRELCKQRQDEEAR